MVLGIHPRLMMLVMMVFLRQFQLVVVLTVIGSLGVRRCRPQPRAWQRLVLVLVLLVMILVLVLVLVLLIWAMMVVPFRVGGHRRRRQVVVGVDAVVTPRVASRCPCLVSAVWAVPRAGRMRRSVRQRRR